MGTLSSELAPHAERLSPRPRVYADANVPAGIVSYMRTGLQWDVLFVLEDEGLRRAPDLKHYQLAHQLRRTLVTLDRDYLDDGRFPPQVGSGVLIVSAPDERQLTALLERVDRSLFRSDPEDLGAPEGLGDAGDPREKDAAEQTALPLVGRKLHVHTDWGRDET